MFDSNQYIKSMQTFIDSILRSIQDTGLLEKYNLISQSQEPD